jgi:hypothetical protein
MCHSMRHQTSIVVLFLSTLLFMACDTHKTEDSNSIADKPKQIIYEKDIGDSSVFRMAVVKSISIPYERTFDTVIIKSQWRFLDEVPSDYPMNYPATYVDKAPYIDTLAKVLNSRIITDSVFDKYINAVLQKKFNGNYPTSLFDTCLGDNLYVNVIAKKLKDNSILVITDYRTVDTSIRVNNKFTRINREWSYQPVNPYNFE